MLTRKDLARHGIDPSQRKFRALLENLQGNILKWHGRRHAAQMFFTIKTGKAADARAWMRTFAEEGHVTSAREQMRDAAASKRLKQPQDSAKTFGSLLVSAAGYRALGGGLRLPSDARFRAGMKRSRRRLKDAEPRAWEPPFRREIHALALLANSRLGRLKGRVRLVRRELRDFADVVTVEYSGTQVNAVGQHSEWFGYLDGRSQPRFFTADIDEQKRVYDGIDVSNPSAPLRLALARDPNTRAADAFGSYLVFRKLEQHVGAFMKREAALGRALALPDPTAGLTGALMVGRFKDGTPVTLSPIIGMGARRQTRGRSTFVTPNNFTFAEDPKGSRCPFQAHIRAVNPRDPATAGHRIVRRGMPYGKGHVAALERGSGRIPARGVGLLFMCFQRDIGSQYEWIQRRANGRAGCSMDPIIGQGRGGAAPLWPTRYGQDLRVRFPSRAARRRGNRNRLVTLRGGEYFFAPSLPFLKSL